MTNNLFETAKTTKLSFDQFVAKAEKIESAELMEMITGGVEETCHPGQPGCTATSTLS
jgi:hypothetical protein